MHHCGGSYFAGVKKWWEVGTRSCVRLCFSPLCLFALLGLSNFLLQRLNVGSVLMPSVRVHGEPWLSGTASISEFGSESKFHQRNTVSPRFRDAPLRSDSQDS